MAFGIGFLTSRKMSTKDLTLLFTSLSYMSTAGMTLREGVDILMQDPNSKLNRTGLQTMLDCFDEGMTLSVILKDHEDIYGTGLWRQVDAAERTGKVPECLLRIAEQFKMNSDVASKIKGALAYPIFIVFIALVAAYYLFTNTIPEMGKMMKEFGADLPPMTLAVMAIADALIDHLILIIIVAVLLVVGIIYALKHPLKMQWHRFILKFPLSGSISVNINYSLVYLLIRDMTENGAHAVEALRVAASSTVNLFIQRELIHCADTMEREGYGLATVLMEATTMPHDDRLMLGVGARTGREMDVLKDMSRRRGIAANESIARLLELMTPIIMVFVCIVVGILVVSIYMPMLTMASAMR